MQQSIHSNMTNYILSVNNNDISNINIKKNSNSNIIYNRDSCNSTKINNYILPKNIISNIKNCRSSNISNINNEEYSNILYNKTKSSNLSLATITNTISKILKKKTTFQCNELYNNS